MERRSPVEIREVLLESENEDGQPGRDVIIMFAVFFEGGLAPLSLFLGWWFGHNPLAHFAWTETRLRSGEPWRPYPWFCSSCSSPSLADRPAQTNQVFL